MESIFVPPDITSVCAEQAAPLTQCSQGGYIFLMLTAYLFGGPNKHLLSSARNNEQNEPETNIEKPNPLELAKEKVERTVSSIFHPSKCSESEFILDAKQYSKYDEVPLWKFDSEKAILDYNFLKQKNFNPFANEEKDKSNDKPSREDKKEYDFIIVGAGSSGCVIANRLTEKKYEVLLLEAGPEEPDITSVPALAGVMGGSNVDWGYRTQPDGRTCLGIQGQSCPSTCGHVMGGSSSINYLTYMRGNRRDYDSWAEAGNIGWSYKDVLPYFKKSEDNRDVEGIDQDYHGTRGPLTVEKFKYDDKNNDMLIKAFNEKGLPVTDFNGKEQKGTAITQTTSKDGKRVSANAAFIEPIRKNRSNLYIKTNAFATGIIIEPIQKVACGVTYVQNGVVKRVYARKEVIVSAGTYNSAKLLQLSGVGPEDELKKLNIPVFSNIKVGHNLQDHVNTEALVMKLSNKTSTLIDIKQIINETLYYYNTRYSNGVLAQTGVLGIVAFIRTPFALDKTAPDIQFHFDARNVGDFYSDPKTYLAADILPFPFNDGINVRSVLVAPESRGVVALNITNPIFGPPLIHSGFLSKQRDRDALKAALKYAIELEETQAFKENGVKFIRSPLGVCKNYTWGTDEYFDCIMTQYTGTIFHPAGTCKMGPKTDKTAVVDPRLKVYGIKHLRVACNAIMRTIVRGNTNAPAIMIGEKASDLIKEDWQGCY